MTPGALTFKEDDEVKYKNKAEFKGKVFIEGDKLHWKNVYTGNNYNVHVTKQQ